MDARGRQADNDVARRQPLARQQRPAFGGADREAREVEIPPRVEPRHFRRLAADQRAAGLDAARRNAPDDGRALARIELAGREIVEEKQRLRALNDDIVDAHGDEVDPDRLEYPALDSDLDLGADAVIGRNQDRVLEPGGLQIEQSAEPADLRIRARPPRRAHQRLDRIDHGIARVDVDASVGVGERVFRIGGHCEAPERPGG